MPMLYFFMGAVAGSVPLMFREAKLTKFSWTVPIYVAIGFLIVLFFKSVWKHMPVIAFYLLLC